MNGPLTIMEAKTKMMMIGLESSLLCLGLLALTRPRFAVGKTHKFNSDTPSDITIEKEWNLYIGDSKSSSMFKKMSYREYGCKSVL